MRNKLWTLTFLTADHSLIPDQQVLCRRLIFHICLNIYVVVWASCRRHFDVDVSSSEFQVDVWVSRQRLGFYVDVWEPYVDVWESYVNVWVTSNFVTNGLPYDREILSKWLCVFACILCRVGRVRGWWGSILMAGSSWSSPLTPSSTWKRLEK